MAAAILNRPDNRPGPLDYAKLSWAAYQPTIRQGQLVSVGVYNRTAVLEQADKHPPLDLELSKMWDKIRYETGPSRYTMMMDFCDQSPSLQNWKGGKGWLVLKTFRNLLLSPSTQGQFGKDGFDPMENEYLHATLFYGLENCQLVLAFKGTTVDLTGEPVRTLRDMSENLFGIVIDLAVTSQRNRVKTLVGCDGIQYLSQHRQFSFTGHSKGGFQAELALHHCLEGSTTPNWERSVNSVVFESTGSYESLVNLQSNIVTNHIPIENYDIVSYLSKPFLVNKLMSKVGTVYQLMELGSHSIVPIIVCLDDALTSPIVHHMEIEGDDQFSKIRLVRHWPSYTVPSVVSGYVKNFLGWIRGNGEDHHQNNPPSQLLTYYEQDHKKILPLCNVHPHVRAFLKLVQLAQSQPKIAATFGQPAVTLTSNPQEFPHNYEFIDNGNYLDVTRLVDHMQNFHAFRLQLSTFLIGVPNYLGNP